VKAINNFKKNFWKYLLVDLGFLGIVFFLMIYAKTRVEQFFIRFESFQVQVEAIESEIANQTIVGLMRMEQIADQVNALVTNTYVFIIFVVPLVIYLLFCLSQSYNFSLAMNKKFNLKYLLKFILFGIPFFVLLFILADFMFQYLAVFLYDWKYMVFMLIFLILILIVFYFWFYIVKKTYDERFKFKMFKDAFFSLKRAILPYIGMVVFAIVSLVFLAILYVRYITASFYSYSWIPMILALILSLAVSQYFRVVYLKRL